MGSTIPATVSQGNTATSNTSSSPSSPSSSQSLTTAPTSIGFGPDDLKKLQLTNYKTGKSVPLSTDYQDAITDVILQQNMMGTSTISVQLTDPSRQILKGIVAQAATISDGQITQGAILSLPGYDVDNKPKTLDFVLVQFTKASDQVQLVFEALTVNRLRGQHGNGSVTNIVGTDVTPVVTSYVNALNYAGSKFPKSSLFGPDYASIWHELTGNASVQIANVALGRGTTADPYEDSWTAISRIASSIGWRVWENGNVVYFGPDEYWLGSITGGVPPINKLKGTTGKNMQVLTEFNEHIQLIDFDWDVGKPFGQATVTAMMNNWSYDIGEIVKVENLGPGSGEWMISAMQRDAFNPQASLTLQVPMPFQSVFDPTSLPLPGFPLK